jgi:endonuclease/exonuclease/phosphatase (EEP) superfamily protein YafD
MSRRDDDHPGSLRNRLGRASATAVVMGPLLLLFGETGRWWQVGDLVSHFRIQFLFFALMAVMVMTFTWGEHRRWLVAAGLNALLHAALIAPWYVPPDAEPDGEARVRVMLANVLGHNPQREAVLEAIREEEPDVLVLLEVTEAWVEALKPLEEEMPHGFALPREGNFGIALMSRRKLGSPLPLRLDEDWPPGVRARVPLGEERSFLLLGAHASPPTSPEGYETRNRQFAALADSVTDPGGPAVVLGDLNCSLFSPQYRAFRTAGNLVNSRQGSGILPSWPAYWPDLMRIPIDHILATPELVCTRCRTVLLPGSDHAAVVADYAWSAFDSREEGASPARR